MRSQKRKLIHHADKTIQFILVSFLSHPSYGQISRDDAFCKCGCLPGTWVQPTAVYLDLKPLKASEWHLGFGIWLGGFICPGF